MQQRRTTAQSGFTLIEMMVSLTIGALILSLVGMIQWRSQESYEQTSAQARAQNLCRIAVTRVLDELGEVAISRFAPDPTSAFGTGSLAYQRPTGVDGLGALTWSDQSRLDLVMDTNELANGIDDDGDGLVDERQLVFTRGSDTATPHSVTLAHGVAEWFPGEVGNAVDDNGNGLVDERGFSLRRVGDLLFVRLSTEVPHSQGQIARWTIETAVRLRN